MNQLEPIKHDPITPREAPTPPVTETPPEEAAPSQDKDEIISALRQALLIAKAQAVCARLGVSEARTAYVLRLSALDGVEDPLTGDDAIRQAVQTVLSDVPELRGGGTGVSGAFRIRRAPAKDAFERGFEQK